MLRVGLTGGIGSGKSTAAEMFRKLGVQIIDADVIAHELVAAGSPLLQQIIDVFGEQYLGSDGSLDRKRLAQQVFTDPDKKKRLESLIHPRVREDIARQLTAHHKQRYVVVVIPLLLETGYTDLIDRVLVVDCEPEQQVQRVKQRDQRDVRQTEQIMQQQLSREHRLQHADDILHNNSDLSHLQRQIENLHQNYLQLSERKA